LKFSHNASNRYLLIVRKQTKLPKVMTSQLFIYFKHDFINIFSSSLCDIFN